MRGLRVEKAFAIVTAIAGLLPALACADDAASGDGKAAEKMHVATSGEENRPLPPGFPGRLVSQSAKGLRLRSLEVSGTAGGYYLSVECQAEFGWGLERIAEQDREASVLIFVVEHDEQTREQNVEGPFGAKLRSYTGHPLPVTVQCTAPLRLPNEKNDGCWVTVIIVGTSESEPARLLANETKFVLFSAAGKEDQAASKRTEQIGVADSER